MFINRKTRNDRNYRYQYIILKQQNKKGEKNEQENQSGSTTTRTEK